MKGQLVKYELETCPFCGCDAAVAETEDGYIVLCFDAMCPVRPSTIPFEDKDAAIEAWNDKTPFYQPETGLRLCPFCGHKPKAMTNRNPVEVGCFNPSCMVIAMVKVPYGANAEGMHTERDLDGAVESARARWDTRE